MPFPVAENQDDEEVIGDEVAKDVDFEYLQEVPYSSSSSAGSIPWTDDAIKQNQQDWQNIERMLSGEHMLPDETELRNEILEWQHKFPQLLRKKNKSWSLRQNQQSFDESNTNFEDSFDIDSLSNLSLNFTRNEIDDEDNNSVRDEEESDRDDLATPTPDSYYSQTNSNHQTGLNLEHSRNNSTEVSSAEIAHLLHKDLRISSVPITLGNRKSRFQHLKGQNNTFRENESANSSPLYSTPTSLQRQHFQPVQPRVLNTPNSLLDVPDSPIGDTKGTNSANITHTRRLRMPPILNVLESKRRFVDLTKANRSFVQLTQVPLMQQQQVKSAVSTKQSELRRRQAVRGWQMPLTAATLSNRFLNNRNSIVLPAINMQHINEHTTTTTADSSADHGPVLNGNNSGRSQRGITNSSFSSSSHNGRQQYHFVTHPRQYNVGLNAIHSTTTSTSTGGRSISAAAHHPRMGLSSFYVPYSATKFK